MPRPLRIEFNGAWYHVMNRGINHQNIYFSDDHKKLFLALLSEGSTQFCVEIHAYCLMDNHYHLLVRTPFANLSKFMRYIDGVYTQRLNILTCRDGSIFRGRYKAILVEEDNYLLHVCRYIHLNPVAANLCNFPGDYYWSSYLAYFDNSIKPKWLHNSFILNLLSNTNQKVNFLQFSLQKNTDDIVEFYKKIKPILGSRVFIDRHISLLNEKYKEEVATDINKIIKTPTMELIVSCVVNYYNIESAAIKRVCIPNQNTPRMIAIYLSRTMGRYSHKQIAEFFTGIKRASIAPLILRFKKLIDENKKIKENTVMLVKIINDALSNANC